MATKKKGAAATEGGTATKVGADAQIAGATEFSPSGAPRQVVPDVDPSHPAVDDNPRAGTTVDQNKIDFNDPTLSGQEAVERNLADAETEAAEMSAETSED